jgi:hypothetical protein
LRLAGGAVLAVPFAIVAGRASAARSKGPPRRGRHERRDGVVVLLDDLLRADCSACPPTCPDVCPSGPLLGLASDAGLLLLLRRSVLLLGGPGRPCVDDANTRGAFRD